MGSFIVDACDQLNDICHLGAWPDRERTSNQKHVKPHRLYVPCRRRNILSRIRPKTDNVNAFHRPRISVAWLLSCGSEVCRKIRATTEQERNQLTRDLKRSQRVNRYRKKSWFVLDKKCLSRQVAITKSTHHSTVIHMESYCDLPRVVSQWSFLS